MNRHHFVRSALLLLFLNVALISGCSESSTDSSPAATIDPVFIYWADQKFDPLTQPHSAGKQPPRPGKQTGDYYFVQFWNESAPGSESTDRLNKLLKFDAKSTLYIKQRAFLVFANAASIAALDKLKEVRWTGKLTADLKITPSTRQLIKDKKPGNLSYFIINLFPEADEKAVLKSLQQLDGKSIYTSKISRFRRHLIALEVGQLAALAELSAVAWIDPYIEPQLINDVARQLDGLPAGNAEPPANNLPQGDSELIGVLDSGLDTGINDANLHPDLAGRVTAIRSYPVIEPGMVSSTVNPGADDGPADLFSGHGTHVAATAIGNGYASNGRYAGVGSGARLFFQAVEQWVISEVNDNEVGNNSLQIADYPEMIAEAYDEDVRIHSNSIGVPVLFNSTFRGTARLLDELVWNHPDLLILFAAGNDGRDEDVDGVEDRCTLNTYGTARNIITVGATENLRSEVTDTYPALRYAPFFGLGYPLPLALFANDLMADDAEQVAAFSGRGPVLAFADPAAGDTNYECKADQLARIKPDIVAPGTFIASARSAVASEPGTDGGAKLLSDYGLAAPGDAVDNKYMLMSGTSMATPRVAGAAARVRQYLRDNLAQTNPSAALVKATLINTARAIGGTGESLVTPDSNQGWGRLNLANIPAETELNQLSVADETQGLWLGNQLNYRITITETTAPLTLTMVYTDYFWFGDSVYHDLNLAITTPTGEVIHPNGRSDPDPVNNIEQIVIAADQLVAGEYLVTVNRIGDNPFVQQPFSLVLRAAAPLIALRRTPIDVVIVMDTSASTNTPACPTIAGCQTSSFNVIQAMADDLIARWPTVTSSQLPNQPGDRIGLVSYASNGEQQALAGQLLIPVAGNKPGLLNMVNTMSTELLASTDPNFSPPTPGKVALGSGIYEAISMLEESDRKQVIVVIGRGLQSMSPTVNWRSEVSYSGTFPNGSLSVVNTLRIASDNAFPPSDLNAGVLLDHKLGINIHTVQVLSPQPADEVFAQIAPETGGIAELVNSETALFPEAIIEAATTLASD